MAYWNTSNYSRMQLTKIYRLQIYNFMSIELKYEGYLTTEHFQYSTFDQKNCYSFCNSKYMRINCCSITHIDNPSKTQLFY